MEVNIKDRCKNVEITRMALNIVGLGVDYITTELILKTLSELDKKKDQFTRKDGVKIEHEWREYWDKYKEENERGIL